MFDRIPFPTLFFFCFFFQTSFSKFKHSLDSMTDKRQRVAKPVTIKQLPRDNSLRLSRSGHNALFTWSGECLQHGIAKYSKVTSDISGFIDRRNLIIKSAPKMGNTIETRQIVFANGNFGISHEYFLLRFLVDGCI